MSLHTAIQTALENHPRTVLRKKGFRQSAVLVPVVDHDDGGLFILTRRSKNLPSHAGQIAFPGGSIDKGEELVTAALREAWEEIALPKERVALAGKLNDIWTPSKFIVTPVVGTLDSAAHLKPNPAEVDRIFTVPLRFFADDSNARTKDVEVNGFKRTVYFYDYDGETIWGATAFIIRNLLYVLGMIDSAMPEDE